MRGGALLLALLATGACSPARYVQRQLITAERELQCHTGFMLFDPARRKTLVQHKQAQYFTPASNTKIFTFYTSLQLLGDSLPALRYQHRNDSLVIWPLGDPSFLNPFTHTNNRVYAFLKNAPGNVYLAAAHFYDRPLGPGWAWSDYTYSYSPERSAMPLYSNLLRVERTPAGLKASPSFFTSFVRPAAEVRESPELERAIAANEFTFFPDATTKAGPWYVPIHFGKGVTAALLADTLKRPVTEVRLPLPAQAAVLRSVPADSVYKVMMQESDNFLAEQLLLACAMQVGDSLYGETAIRYAKKNLLFDLPDEPRWVDGSGLSRYNLFTPRSIVRLWEKIYTLVPRERLLPLLATGGQAGTIKNYYKADKPYVFGKTGTLSNNHCLSGFVVTEKGRTLIFSYMNSNFVSPTHEVRTYMENILDHIRRRY